MPVIIFFVIAAVFHIALKHTGMANMCMPSAAT